MDGSVEHTGVGMAVVVVVDHDFGHFSTENWVDSSIPDFTACYIEDYKAFYTRLRNLLALASLAHLK